MFSVDANFLPHAELELHIHFDANGRLRALQRRVWEAIGVLMNLMENLTDSGEIGKIMKYREKNI